ncbi:MAG: class I SAM-dependent methyltransferase, partial [Pseudomonadota bacterium]
MEVVTTYEPYAQEPEYIGANKALLETIDLAPVKRVLDLACGTGLMTDLLMQLKPGIAVNGIDLSGESLSIGRRQLKEKGLLVESQEALDEAAAAGRSAMYMVEGSAMDLDHFADNTFDMCMIGNAIHLMPDKAQFVRNVFRVLKPGAPFTFNSVFFTGTFGEGSEPVYKEWMMGAVNILMEKNAERAKAGEAPIKRQRGKAGKAFDKDWKTPEGWSSLLEEAGFEVERVYKRPIPINQRGLELVGAYGGLAEVLMSGYPVDVASECLQYAVGPAFEKMGVSEVVRYWLEVTGVKK